MASNQHLFSTSKLCHLIPFSLEGDTVNVCPSFVGNAKPIAPSNMKYSPLNSTHAPITFLEKLALLY